MWDLPGSGLEPVSPALAGGFLNTAPPGKSKFHPFLKTFLATGKVKIMYVALTVFLLHSTAVEQRGGKARGTGSTVDVGQTTS